MARMIDGDKLVENLRLIATCWSVSPYVSKEKHNGAVNMLREVEREVKEAPTLTPQNEPLTLDELLKMDGEPVWVKCLKPSQYAEPPVRWRILEKSITGNFGVWNGDCALIERTYGVDWLAYRRPPEKQEDTQ